MTSASNSKPLPTTPSANTVNRETASSSPTRNDLDNNKAVNTPDRHSKTGRNADSDDDEEFEFFNNFEREKVKSVIHSITAELKERGADVEYLMIPFRPQQTNEKLLKLLNSLFPMGNGQPVPEKQMWKIVKKVEPLTLFQGLKYIWCRLPEGQVIGWKAYLEFKIREKSKDFPRRGFLEIMPQCLESPSHASIVYDFFDLIITLASNSRINKMSARKISKMCAVWAFGSPNERGSKPLDYDFTNTSTLPNNSFQDGLEEWIPGTDAMFHLLLAFLKSFVPQEMENSKLPHSLKSLLFNNDYPPKGSTAYSMETILTIPLVTLQTDKFSRKPWQLLERCNELLDFTDHDAFQAREDFALLKSLFKKKNNVEGISRKMSQESRRLMKLMSTKHSTFQAGWATRKCLPNESHLKENIEVSRVEIDDYFIWAWLSTLSYEQTSEKKKMFGRSLILEFEFDGFKKWVMFQECDITLESKKRQMQRDMMPPVNSLDIAKTSRPDTDSQRKVTPTYESFQNRVSSSGSRSAESSPGETYHTVITKESLAKNSAKNNVNLHSIEQKISKWNPLSKVRKKSSSHSTTSSKEELPVPETKQKKKESLVINHNSIYQLPPIECDADDFKDIFAAQGSSEDEGPEAPPLRMPSPKPKRTPPPENREIPTNQDGPNRNSSQEAMEELKGMVDQMMTDDISKIIFDDGSSTTVNSNKENFEDYTKFEQYKTSNEDFVDTPTSASSAVPSLKLDRDVPSLKPSDAQPAPQIIPVSPGLPPPQALSHPQAEARAPRDLNKRLPEIRVDGPATSQPSAPPPRAEARLRASHQPPSAPAAEPARYAAPQERAARQQSPTRYAAPPEHYHPAPQEHYHPAPPPPTDQYAQRQQSPPGPTAQPAAQPAAHPAARPAAQPAALPAPDPRYPHIQEPPRPVADPYAQRRQSPQRQGPYADHRGPAQAASPEFSRPPRHPEPHPAQMRPNYYHQPPVPSIAQHRPQKHASPTRPALEPHHPQIPADYYAPAPEEYYPQRRAQYAPPRQQPHYHAQPPMPADAYAAQERLYASPDARYYNNYRSPKAPAQPFAAPVRSASPGRPMRSPPMPAPAPSAPFAPPAPHGNKLHGQTNRQQERKKLHNNIRNGNFGI